MNQKYNHLWEEEEESLDTKVKRGKNEYGVKAIGIRAVIAVCISAVFIAGFHYVSKVLTQDDKSVSVSAEGEIDWKDGKVSGKFDVTYSSGNHNPASPAVDDEDSSLQNPQEPDRSTVMVTAPKSCWIYDAPDTQSKRESYAEKGDVLPYIDFAFSDSDTGKLFYKVQYVDKNDNKTMRIGFMNAEWGELTPA